MVSSQRILIDIASAAHRVIEAVVTYARDKNDRNIDISRTRLGGELHRIVAASGTILKETLQHDTQSTSGTDSTFDDRLTDWLSGDEPQMCLDSLNTMEKSIRSRPSRAASRLLNPFRSTSSEDKIREAITVFEGRRDCFHFLLTTDVWNRETAIKSPSVVDSLSTPSTMPRQSTKFGSRDVSRETATSESTVKVDMTRLELNQMQLSEVLGWLDAWNCMSKHEDTLELRQPDTCTWLFDTPEYTTWRSIDDSFLWLHGKPGSGKSVLAASVIDNLEHTLQGEPLVFFYCDFRNERSTAAAEVSRSILSQLLHRLDDLSVDPGDTLDSLIKEKKRSGSILTNAMRLAPLVLRVAKQFTQQPLIVIDALDECKDIEGLLDTLLLLNQGGMRLFVVSRPLQVIKDSFAGLTWLSLEEMHREVSGDIKLHVTREIDSHRRLRIADAKLKEEMTRTLCDKADGMFRWIQCQLDTLKRCVTAMEIREALESLPVGLDATYERILQETNKEERGGRIARRVLAWLVVALKPLLLCQLVEVLTIDLGRRVLNPDAGPMHGHALLDTLGSLVTHDEETDTVLLSHFSVKEYFVGRFLQRKHSYHIDEQDAHAQVARQCMCYIAAYLKLGKRKILDVHPLLDYAIPYGFHHLAHIKPTRLILDAVVALHLDVLQQPLEWERMRKLNDYRILWQKFRGLPSLGHDFVFYILICYAPESLLRLHLGRGPLRVKEGTNPLIYAVTRDVGFARLLLSRGARLDLRGRFIWPWLPDSDCVSGLPIEAAAQGGNLALLDLFISEGSPVPHSLFSAALFPEKTVSTVHAPAVARLLQTDEFVEWAIEVQDEIQLFHALMRCYRYLHPRKNEMTTPIRRFQQIGYDLANQDSIIPALCHAASSGDLSTVEYILSNVQVPLPHRILLVASICSDTNDALICFLIRHGVDVRASFDDGSTALHLTMSTCADEEDCVKRAKILIDAGCDPSASNLAGETPVRLAARHGHIAVIKHLLSTGVALPPDILLDAIPGFCGSNRTRSPAFRFLLSQGAEPRIIAPDGDTVLHIVLRSYSNDREDCLETTRLLVAAGCDPCAQNSKGETPLHLAVATGYIPVVNYLLSLNAPVPSDIIRCVSSNGSLAMVKFLLANGADACAAFFDGSNALYRAISPAFDIFHALSDNNRCIQTIQTLVDAGCDPSAHDFNGNTLFHVAAQRRRTDVIEYLSSRGYHLPSNILLSVSFGVRRSSRTIRFLVNKGADVRTTAADGNTPLHFVITSSSEPFALECAEILIDAGSNPCALNSSHQTPIHVAARRGYLDVVNYLLSIGATLPLDVLLVVADSRLETIAPLIRFFIKRGAEVTTVAENGDTVLHLALVREHHADDLLETTRILIDAGCDIHARNNAGDTPLYIAAKQGHIAIVERYASEDEVLPPHVVLAAAANGHVCIIEYVLSHGGQLPPTILIAAASCADDSKQADIVQFLASLQGIDARIVESNGDTALHRAVKSAPFVETVDILIGLGCDPSCRNLAGETPFHISAREQYTNHFSILKYFLSKGAPLPPDVLLSAALRDRDVAKTMRLLIREGADPNASYSSGDTPLHILFKRAKCRHELEWESIQVLLNAGGDPYARNLRGRTPVEVAEENGTLCAQNFMRLVGDARKGGEEDDSTVIPDRSCRRSFDNFSCTSVPE